MEVYNSCNQPKSGKYCGTEVWAMIKVLFENADIIQESAGEVLDEIFQQMAKATEGKRTTSQVKRWYYNLKMIRQLNHRFTAIVDKVLPLEEERQKLHTIMFAKGLQLGDVFNKMTFYPSLKEELEQEEEEQWKESAMKCDWFHELGAENQEAFRTQQHSG